MPRRNKTNKRNKNRRCWSRRNRSQYGGAAVHVGAPVNDTSMALGQKDNLAQGQQFADIHKTQHGGFWFAKAAAAATAPMAPMKEMSVGKGGSMDAAPAATRGSLSGSATRGSVPMPMKAMKGGSRRQRGGSAPYPLGVTNSTLEGPMIAAARTGPLDTAISQIQGMSDQSGGRRRGKKGNKANRKSQKKNRNVSRRRRNMRGGAYGTASGSPVTADSMLLPSGLEKSAQLNSDWDAARNPNYWAPKQ
jgi:hypothetical protein